MGDDCKVDPDEMLESWKGGRSDEAVDILVKYDTVRSEVAARASELEKEATEWDRKAADARARAEHLRREIGIVDPPLPTCAGGAPRKPVVRKSRKTAVGPKKATQRRAKAAAKPKAPKAQRKGKRAEAGSGAGNGKRGRKPAQPTADELVKALGKFGFFGGAAGMAETFGWPEHTTKRRITEAAKAGLIRNDGSRKAPQWVVV